MIVATLKDFTIIMNIALLLSEIFMREAWLDQKRKA